MIIACLVLTGIGFSLFTRPEPPERRKGLTWGSVADAVAGSPAIVVTPVREKWGTPRSGL